MLVHLLLLLKLVDKILLLLLDCCILLRIDILSLQMRWLLKLGMRSILLLILHKMWRSVILLLQEAMLIREGRLLMRRYELLLLSLLWIGASCRLLIHHSVKLGLHLKRALVMELVRWHHKLLLRW